VKLTVAQVEARILQPLADKGYSTSVISRTRSAGRRAFRRAERDGLLSRNVFELADIPRGTVKVSRSMTREQVAQLLRSGLTPWWLAYASTGLMLGLRPGELAALRWQDVRFGDGVITVRQSMSRAGGTLHAGPLKTASSRRTLAMPRAVGSALTVLRREQAADRLRLGARYDTSGLVFADETGRPVWPQAFTAGFAAVCESAGIGRFTPRELRHTFVSVMSDSGVPIEDIADLAGHINSGITRSVYRHVIADKLTAAATVMDDVFRDVSGS
jgi:integrase